MEHPPLIHILYVEDDADIRKITEITLTMLGKYQVTSCKSGEQALEKAKTIQAQMVILDVMMPGMDGPEVFRQLRTMKNYRTVPIAFITAKVQPNEVDSYMQMGAIGVIPKPYEPADLPQHLLALWNKSQDSH